MFCFKAQPLRNVNSEGVLLYDLFVMKIGVRLFLDIFIRLKAKTAFETQQTCHYVHVPAEPM